MTVHVAVLGGGVAGLSAAHELIKRGFRVSVYESKQIPGGKARSIGYNVAEQGSRLPLPAEHGFRFIPAFYRHLPKTMQEIDVGGNKTVHNHLVSTEETLLARHGGMRHIYTPNQFPNSLGDLIKAFKAFKLFYCDLGISKPEVRHFIRKLIAMMVSCNERRFGEYEDQSWWEYIEAEDQSAAFQDYLAKGLSRSLVALNAKDLSARTGACILLQFLFGFLGGEPLDRILDLPTNDAWINPWLEQLKKDSNFQYHLGSHVESIQCDPPSKRITTVHVTQQGQPKEVVADYYIAALPVEVMQVKLTDEMVQADPDLAAIHHLKTSWMTGIIFYLNRDVPIVEGHANFLDSDWALTSISQAQFWETIDLSDYGDGTVQSVLSVIISNWDEPLFGNIPAANTCTRDEVVEYVWQQLTEHLNSTQNIVLRDSDRVCYFLAPCLSCTQHHGESRWENDEPLFINTAGSWFKRPEVVTGIENLFLASDYVRTHTDLATMESANEAARRAVNGILVAENSNEEPCDVWSLQEPAILAGYKFLDRIRYRRGKPPLVPPIAPMPWIC